MLYRAEPCLLARFATVSIFGFISFSQYALRLDDHVADRLNFSLVTVLTAAAYKLATGQLVPHVSYVTSLDIFVLTSIATVSIHTMTGPSCHLIENSDAQRSCDLICGGVNFLFFLAINWWLLRKRIRDAVTTVWEAASTHGARTSSVEMADDARRKRESYELELVVEAASSHVERAASEARMSRVDRPKGSADNSGVS